MMEKLPKKFPIWKSFPVENTLRVSNPKTFYEIQSISFILQKQFFNSVFSSAIVSLVYLCFIFMCYGKRSSINHSPTQTTCSSASSTTTIDTTSSATEKTLTPGPSDLTPSTTTACEWSIILGVPGERVALVLR